MPFGALGQDQLGAERAQHPPALDRHRLGHGEHERVAARGAHEGQRDAGVAAGRLDHRRLPRSGLEDAVALGRPDHGRADPALDRVGRIASLDLGGQDAVEPWVMRLSRTSGVLPMLRLLSS